jgi:hypothetical protein
VLEQSKGAGSTFGVPYILSESGALQKLVRLSLTVGCVIFGSVKPEEFDEEKSKSTQIQGRPERDGEGQDSQWI